MKRQARVPGTNSPRWGREIVCGGDPARALVHALAEFRAIRRGQVWSVDVHHDDGCAALKAGGPMALCSCEIVQLEARRAA